MRLFHLVLAVAMLAAPGLSVAQPAAPTPLYRDPVHDGAADAAVVREPSTGRWLMFYTNRRADLTGLPAKDVSWVYGTRIGVAESADGGTTWRYRGLADLPVAEPTQWAPEIVEDHGLHHMFLTVVPGVFKDWNGARRIVHLTSPDLTHWTLVGPLDLSSDRVIDASVLKLPDGTWRLWYKDERDGSAIRYADSPDLSAWTPKGRAIAAPPGEGPKVFVWKGRTWMVVDHWNGLGVYGSDDALTWTPQPGRLLDQPGKRPTDQAKGQHADVVVSGDRAYLFYFTHQENAPQAAADPLWRRRSVVQVTELKLHDGRLTLDRDTPTVVVLQPATATSRRSRAGSSR
ncbi:MAG: hypothetical protein JWP92_3614 [Caulobacter sp.]|nr:hypothetical protein [Caulobacter sp.]